MRTRRQTAIMNRHQNEPPVVTSDWNDNDDLIYIAPEPPPFIDLTRNNATLVSPEYTVSLESPASLVDMTKNGPTVFPPDSMQPQKTLTKSHLIERLLLPSVDFPTDNPIVEDSMKRSENDGVTENENNSHGGDAPPNPKKTGQKWSKNDQGSTRMRTRRQSAINRQINKPPVVISDSDDTDDVTYISPEPPPCIDLTESNPPLVSPIVTVSLESLKPLGNGSTLMLQDFMQLWKTLPKSHFMEPLLSCIVEDAMERRANENNIYGGADVPLNPKTTGRKWSRNRRCRSRSPHTLCTNTN